MREENLISGRMFNIIKCKHIWVKYLAEPVLI